MKGKRKIMIIVLDTETLGLFDKRVYDLGYIIYDNDKKQVVKERDYIIKQVYDNENLMKSAYYKNKRPLYEIELQNGNAKKIYWGMALYILLKDIERYNVSELYAYNSRFDLKAIAKTCEAFNKNVVIDHIADIMDYINIITDTQEYKDFCFNNNYLTKHKKPQCRKTAEVVYRYVTDNNVFIEDHMALSDSRIELEILKKALGLE